MKLNWTIDEARGVLRFGHGPVPRTGNAYSVEVSGGRAGAEYVFSVVSDDAREILAQSTHGDGGTEIAFTSDTLRQAFRGRWHEQRTFHCVASDGRNVVAEGDLTVECIPVWTDAETGRVVSMRGPQGVGIEANEPVGFDGEGNALYQLVLTNGQRLSWTAPRGQIGESANGNYAYDPATGKYRRIVVYTNAIGEKLVDLDREELDEPPSGGRVVTVSDKQTITGAKTFTRKLEAGGGVVGNLTGDVTGNLTGDVTGNVTGNVTGDVTGGLDASGDGKTVIVPTVEESANDGRAASTKWVNDVLGSLIIWNDDYQLSAASVASKAWKAFTAKITPPGGYDILFVVPRCESSSCSVSYGKHYGNGDGSYTSTFFMYNSSASSQDLRPILRIFCVRSRPSPPTGGGSLQDVVLPTPSPVVEDLTTANDGE